MFGVIGILSVVPSLLVGEAPYHAKSSHAKQYVTQWPDHGQVDGEDYPDYKQEKAEELEAFIVAGFLLLIHSPILCCDIF
jgi:hypothetical protein